MLNQLLLNESLIEPVLGSYKLVEDRLIEDNFFMSLQINFPDEWEIYRLYEPKRHKKDKTKIIYDEQAKIRFMTYSKFPDGVFIQKRGANSYKIFVFELKKNAANHLSDISKQLHSGILHGISLINLSEVCTNNNEVVIPANLDIDYELFVFSGKKVERPVIRRPIPGRVVKGNTRLEQYLNGSVYEKIKGQELFIFQINTIETVKKLNEDTHTYYYSQVDIS
ncbi:MAG: hypothetical protein ACRCXQ_14885 [Vagococcus fluvialis]